MPVRIRLSRGGAKKRPFYRIVVADSRRARDGKFIDQVGTYNPMLPKDSPDRVKIDVEKAKDWMAKGAQPSDRVTLFLSNLGAVDKPIITEKTKEAMQEILANIQSGNFANEFLDDCRQSNDGSGGPFMKSNRKSTKNHPIEKVGKELRAMMPWIGKNKLVDKDKN